MGATSVFPVVRILADYSKDPVRYYKNRDGEIVPVYPYLGKVKLQDLDGNPAEAPDTHQFGPDFVERGEDQGWLSVTGAKESRLKLEQPHGRPVDGMGRWDVRKLKTITLHTVDGDVKYNVTRNPGIYDAETGDAMADDVRMNDQARQQGYHDRLEVLLGYDVEKAS